MIIKKKQPFVSDTLEGTLATSFIPDLFLSHQQCFTLDLTICFYKEVTGIFLISPKF